jgi:hypothetical protein
MPRQSDGKPTLGVTVACEIAGLAPSKRRDWVEKGVLDQPLTAAKLSELQVVELALLRELHDDLGPKDAAVVWSASRDLLLGGLLAPHLDLVVDLGYREAVVVTDASALADAVRTGRPVKVLPLAALTRRVRDAFRRMTEERSRRAAPTRKGRKASAS